MAKLYIKIVGAEGDSVLVKYASDSSAKTVDEYDAVAFQPKAMGYSDVDSFIKGITPILVPVVAARDKAENIITDPSDWVNHTAVYDIPKSEPVVPFNPVLSLDTSADVLL
jgi:hypothetical protein